MYTPTYTPHIANVHNGAGRNELLSTTDTLNSLVSFYQHERMWAYRMQAMLQESYTPQVKDDGPDQLHEAHPECTPDFSSSSQEYGFVDETRLSEEQTRWMRRKRGFKLRLEGIRSKRVSPLQYVQEQKAERLRPREQMLQMFEKMMEARMESCQRVNKLVQEASRNTQDQASIGLPR
jgi:hypothetical protein